MKIKIEKLQAYIAIKWGLVLISSPALIFGLLIGGVSAAEFLFLSLLLILSSAINFYLFYLERKTDFSRKRLYAPVFFDIFLIILAINYSGGIESGWLYLPAVFILVVSMIFPLYQSLAYTAFAYLLLVALFLAQYFNVMPHHAMISGLQLPWRAQGFFVDRLSSYFALYFLTALAGSLLNRQIEKGLQQATLSQTESENSRRALMNIASDLKSAQQDLESRVKERTASLEKIKAELELKVRARTADLENSRKAILHMMKDLKEDIKKLREVDQIKTEFLSMISHELRTPLTLIKGYVSLLLAGKIGPLSSEQMKTVNIVARQGEHLQTMIESILDISRLEIGKPIPLIKAPMSIKLTLERTIEAIKLQADEKKIELAADISGFLPTIIGDETKIKRLFINILGNALKFTPEGGKITVNAFVDDSQVKVEVIDNGIGISQENLGKLFEKFFQADSSITRTAGGMGMGLAIAKELVELHGGKIKAESAGPGKGSKFTFSLPINSL
ncbi:MAG: HAMP domain-containing histidine kinase [Candidatus Margulisbacteria bacterium]|nr:HAMP domain-containing histidine kinase [Candidatus Margulisiibacteriota bacterium]